MVKYKQKTMNKLFLFLFLFFFIGSINAQTAPIKKKTYVDEQKILNVEAATPRAGYISAPYRKADGNWYEKTDAGVEQLIIDTVAMLATKYDLSNVTGEEKYFENIAAIPTTLELGERIKIEDTGAEYFVQSTTVAGYNSSLADGVAVIDLGGSKYAVLQSENGTYNVDWFGAVGDGSTDNTLIFINSHDFAVAQNGAKIFIPATDAGYNITHVYMTSGITFYGVGSGTAQNGQQGHSLVNIINDGQGFIFGFDSYNPNLRADGCTLKNLKIVGNALARSGLRIGSDVSFITPTRFICENLLITGFTSSTVNQIVYDNTTVAFGSSDANFEGTKEYTGACGIFIAGIVNASFKNVTSQQNFDGLGESTGGFGTTVTFSSCSFRDNDRFGINLYQANSWEFTERTIFEANDSSAINIDIPVSAIAKRKFGAGNLIFNGIHTEQNNFNDNGGYAIFIRNQNSGENNTGITFTNSFLHFRKNGFKLERVDDFIIKENGRFSLPATDTILFTVNCTSVTYEGPDLLARTSLDGSTLIKSTTGYNLEGKITPNGGGLASDHRAKGTTLTTTEENLLIPGDIIFWQASTNTSDYQRGVVTLQAWGSFASDDNAKNLKIKIGTVTVSENVQTTNPNGVQWYCEVKVRFVNTVTAKYSSTLTIGNQTEIMTGTITNSFWENQQRMYVYGTNSVATINGILCQGAFADIIQSYK